MRLFFHQRLEKWLIIHTFYNWLTYNTYGSVDAAAGEALMNKNIDDACNLIEDMAHNHYQWSNEGSTQQEVPRKHDVDAFKLTVAKVNALLKFCKLNMNVVGIASVSCEISD